MRLLVEIVIIAGLIYLGWNKPFKEWASHGGVIANSKIHVPAWEDNSAAQKSTPAKKNSH